MLAAGFSHVDCAPTLQCLSCLPVTGAGSRYVPITGVTTNPDGPWTTQQIRNLLMTPASVPPISGSWSQAGHGSSARHPTRSWPVPASTR